MTFQPTIEWIARGLEEMGVGVVAIGAVMALVHFVKRLYAGDAFDPQTTVVCERLARATLLGLEFLVAADIIGTVVAIPTAMNLLMLGGVILLRTFLSATLRLEVEGRWPWDKTPRKSLRAPFPRPSLEAIEESAARS